MVSTLKGPPSFGQFCPSLSQLRISIGYVLLLIRWMTLDVRMFVGYSSFYCALLLLFIQCCKKKVSTQTTTPPILQEKVGQKEPATKEVRQTSKETAAATPPTKHQKASDMQHKSRSHTDSRASSLHDDKMPRAQSRQRLSSLRMRIAEQRSHNEQKELSRNTKHKSKRRATETEMNTAVEDFSKFMNKLQRTQDEDESWYDVNAEMDQHRARVRRMIENDATLNDAPSLKRIDTSKTEASVYGYPNVKQTESAESILGPEVEVADQQDFDQDTCELVRRAESMKPASDLKKMVAVEKDIREKDTEKGSSKRNAKTARAITPPSKKRDRHDEGVVTAILSLDALPRTPSSESPVQGSYERFVPEMDVKEEPTMKSVAEPRLKRPSKPKKA
ncbi:unnamed protein product [Cylicocyclus nassatus]|uniref:Uncharacterized protein n=1 Tax=Cylicocyclus nassatus TaxID=53992 RepID=A0AA36HBA4_CYLNA|nr:unnamed protein product [Cylicocyclus nassatus]